MAAILIVLVGALQALASLNALTEKSEATESILLSSTGAPILEQERNHAAGKTK
jgi:hypothetical protein